MSLRFIICRDLPGVWYSLHFSIFDLKFAGYIFLYSNFCPMGCCLQCCRFLIIVPDPVFPLVPDSNLERKVVKLNQIKMFTTLLNIYVNSIHIFRSKYMLCRVPLKVKTEKDFQFSVCGLIMIVPDLGVTESHRSLSGHLRFYIHT